jgi:hypothetical protein
MYNRRLSRLGLFQPEDVNNIFFRNVGSDLPDYEVVREHEASQFWEPQIVYRVSQEERSIFWEVIVSAILRRKQKFICTCVLFRTVSEIELFHCTVPNLLIRKRYYVLFLILVFIVHVTKLVQFT